MRNWLLCLFSLGNLIASELKPEQVVVVYNRAMPESKQLADFYQKARQIPQENLIGLELPFKADISPKEFQDLIQTPLQQAFDKNQWWIRQKDNTGTLLPIKNDKRVILLMRGVPLRMTRSGKNDEASVDSELALFGVQGPNITREGPLKNAYFDQHVRFPDANLPFQVLVSRIDSPVQATCLRMIQDAIDTEKTGLWGKAYVDIANKYPEGDAWLEQIVKLNRESGIPTSVDRFSETFPVGYPMNEAALYFGWYDWNISGPFLKPDFHFKKGAIAMHLHSFSAEQLADTRRNWSAALLEKGAAATIGNVFEPYLHMTHHFHILHQNLLLGDTFVEAAWKSMPVCSWQGVVLGDPLYRPYEHFDGSGNLDKNDQEYRAIRAAAMQWPGQTDTQIAQFKKAASRLRSGTLLEAAAGLYEQRQQFLDAKATYSEAKRMYISKSDQARTDLSRIALERLKGSVAIAKQQIEQTITLYQGLPEAASFQAWQTILNPPPPPAPPKK